MYVQPGPSLTSPRLSENIWTLLKCNSKVCFTFKKWFIWNNFWKDYTKQKFKSKCSLINHKLFCSKVTTFPEFFFYENFQIAMLQASKVLWIYIRNVWKIADDSYLFELFILEWYFCFWHVLKKIVRKWKPHKVLLKSLEQPSVFRNWHCAFLKKAFVNNYYLCRWHSACSKNDTFWHIMGELQHWHFYLYL